LQPIIGNTSPLHSTRGVKEFYRNKREAYRGSEFAPRILSDAGIPVVLKVFAFLASLKIRFSLTAFKSDHPVINSRYLMYEAQQAHYFGLPDNLALAAVTSTPAIAAGLSHRIGILQEGADADVVIWDSHPLQLAATPVKVWVDGILQIPVPYKTGDETKIEVGKGKEGDEWREVPDVPKWDKERKDTVLWEGLPPLQGKMKNGRIVFSNVKHLLKKRVDGNIEEVLSDNSSEIGVVVVDNGRIVCVGASCLSATGTANMVDLHGGSISPGLMSFGSLLGLEEIAAESSTGDGEPYNAFIANIPNILDDSGGVLRAMDALMFHTRNAL
jgi:Amidohydrolase family